MKTSNARFIAARNRVSFVCQIGKEKVRHFDVEFRFTPTLKNNDLSSWSVGRQIAYKVYYSAFNVLPRQENLRLVCGELRRRTRYHMVNAERLITNCFAQQCIRM